MENKESGIARPLGICERLFRALHLNHTFRSLRRIGYHSQEPVAAAAAMPAPQPPVPSPVTQASAPPTRSSGPEHPGGAAGSLRQAAVSEKTSPEARLSKIESESVAIPVKAPSKVEPPVAATIPSKKFTNTEAQAPPPPPSRLSTERASDTTAKVPAPPPAPAPPPPEKVASKLKDAKAVADSAKPAEAAGMGRSRSLKNLNERIDAFISRTTNKMRAGSNVGSSSSKGGSE